MPFYKTSKTSFSEKKLILIHPNASKSCVMLCSDRYDESKE